MNHLLHTTKFQYPQICHLLWLKNMLSIFSAAFPKASQRCVREEFDTVPLNALIWHPEYVICLLSKKKFVIFPLNLENLVKRPENITL